MEPLGRQGFEAVFVVKLVYRDGVVAVETVQEEQDFRQFLRRLVLPLLAVFHLELQVFDPSHEVNLSVCYQKLLMTRARGHTNRYSFAFLGETLFR